MRMKRMMMRMMVMMMIITVCEHSLCHVLCMCIFFLILVFDVNNDGVEAKDDIFYPIILYE
jgi:hypothetical protein